MKNIKMDISGNTLTLTIDLSQDFGPSKSGKTIIIASSEGNKKLPNDSGVVIGLNCYRPR